MHSLSVRATAWILVGVGLVGLAVQGCSDDDDDFDVGPPAAPALVGQVLSYTDDVAQDVPVAVRGGASGKTTLNGLIQLGPVSAGSQVLEIGDSVATPTLLLPFTAAAGGTFLERPIYLPDLESGIGANLPGSVASVTTIQGAALPGVTLRVDAGTAITSFGGEVNVLGISPSRLPVPVEGGANGDSEPRAAYLVEPHGIRFNPVATLTVPRLEPLGAGPFDAYRVDPANGRWTLHASDVAVVGSASSSFEVPVTIGTLYAVVPRTVPSTVTITGRIVAGTQPVAGYRATCWNRTSPPTDADGTFQIQGVPNTYGVFLVRAHPEQPGVGFRPEVVTTTALNPNLGDIQVAARPPDGIRPTVRATSPRDGQTNVSRATQVVVTFSEAIDPANTAPFKVIGVNGDVAGQYIFDNAFTVRFRPNENLKPSDPHTILVERSVTDLAGNALDDDQISFVFTTAGGAAAAPPTDTLAFGLTPRSGSFADSVFIPGRNFTGGSAVSFGGTNGLVRAETTDLIEVATPDFVEAGDVTISVSAGGVAVGSLFPLVFDLRATVATIFSGTNPDEPLVFVDRAQPPTFVVDGHNAGGTTVTVDGIGIAAVNSTVLSGGTLVATGRTITFSGPAPATLLTGPVVLRGSNGKASKTYRFLHVRE